MSKRSLQTIMLTAAMLLCGCTTTFLASKDGKGYFLGSGSQDAFRLFCGSGDLRMVLDETQLGPAMKEDLYQKTCGPDRSPARIKELFAAMTREQRKELRTSFKKHGYDINMMQC